MATKRQRWALDDKEETAEKRQRKRDPWGNKGFPADSLLAGMEPLVYNELLSLSPDTIKSYSKQMAIRQALRRLNLGWVATNTTFFRKAVGALCDAARQQKGQMDKSLFTRSIDIQTNSISSNSLVKGPLVAPLVGAKRAKKIAFTKAQRQAVWVDLHTRGASVIRQALDRDNLATVIECVNKQLASSTNNKKQAKLRETMGNGVAGTPANTYCDLPANSHNAPLVELEKAIWNLLLGDGTPYPSTTARSQKRKNIVLQYGVDAENWAHQDNNREAVPVQAILLLSAPGTNFVGGQFYVVRRDDDDNSETVRIIRHSVEWENAGDLILFMASKESGWWHGMMTAGQGSCMIGEDESENEQFVRKAIGMLQPR